MVRRPVGGLLLRHGERTYALTRALTLTPVPSCHADPASRPGHRLAADGWDRPRGPTPDATRGEHRCLDSAHLFSLPGARGPATPTLRVRGRPLLFAQRGCSPVTARGSSHALRCSCSRVRAGSVSARLPSCSRHAMGWGGAAWSLDGADGRPAGWPCVRKSLETPLPRP